MSTNPSNFAKMLSQVRREAGLNQKQAAKELGISQALLSHYENGVREPKFEFVLHVCRYFGVSADYLLGRVSEQEPELAYSQAVRQTRAVKAVLALSEPSEQLTDALIGYLSAAMETAVHILRGTEELSGLNETALRLAQEKLLRTAAETKSRLICSEDSVHEKYPKAYEAYREASASVAELRAELGRLLDGAGKEENQ